MDMDQIKEGLSFLIQPEILPYTSAIIIGWIIAIGLTETMKSAPFMQNKSTEAKIKARTWYLKITSRIIGTVSTIILWPVEWNIASVMIAIAAGFLSPLVYDIVQWVLAKIGIRKKSNNTTEE